MPRFDARGRQVPGSVHDTSELDEVTSTLAHQLSGASHPRGGQPVDAPPPGGRGGEHWSVGDLLNHPPEPEPSYGGASGYGTSAQAYTQAPPSSGGALGMDEIARAMDQRTAAEVWRRFKAGERGVLGRHLYNLDGQGTFDEVSYRYANEGDFRMSVDRYIGDFERLLGDAEASDPDGRMMQTYLTSDQGRAYLLLAHASGRLQ
jgi:hypothetical protein